MFGSEFWKLYNDKFKIYEGPGFRVLDYPLSGDHGSFEMAIYKNNKGIWCYERTIERSNNSYHKEFESEEKAFEHIMREIRFRINILK